MHYADGTEAKVGDFVTGQPYNTPHLIAGTIISITSGAESCNCQVQWTEAFEVPVGVLEAEALPWPRMVRYEAGRPVFRFVHGEQHGTAGKRHALVECVDYGEVRAFTPVRKSE